MNDTSQLDSQRAINSLIDAGTVGDTIDEMKQHDHRLDRRAALVRYNRYVMSERARMAALAGLDKLSFKQRLLLDGGMNHVLMATDAVYVWAKWVDWQRPVERTFAPDGTYIDKHGAPDINVAIGKMRMG